MAKLSEDQKTELTFQMDAFNKPLELTKYQAWAQEVITVMMMEPGTLPSSPLCGCGFNAQLMKDVEYLNNTVSAKVNNMVEEYLEEIPFDSISFEEYDIDKSVILVYINFTTSSMTVQTVVTAMSANKTSGGIDFSNYFLMNREEMN